MNRWTLIRKTPMLHDCGHVLDRFQWTLVEIRCWECKRLCRPVGYIMMLKTLERQEPFAWSEEGPRKARKK